MTCFQQGPQAGRSQSGVFPIPSPVQGGINKGSRAGSKFLIHGKTEDKKEEKQGKNQKEADQTIQALVHILFVGEKSGSRPFFGKDFRLFFQVCIGRKGKVPFPLPQEGEPP